MPTTYAHWRFGCDCIQTLTEPLQKCISKHRDLYDIGVHGPDVFFYDLKHPEVPAYGHRMHAESGRVFFESAVKVYNEHGDRKEEMMAYLLGFLSHYALDSQCHAYIDNKDKSSDKVSHNKIESEYDAHLMRQEGKSVALTNRAKPLKPSRSVAAITARFFPFSEEEMLKAEKGQLLIISLLVCRTSLKRSIAKRVFERLKKYDYRDLLVQTKEMPECIDSNLRLDKLKAYALEVYPRLAKELTDAIEHGTPLSDYFELTFDPRDKSPVLSPEEERDYVPDKNF